VIGVTADGNVYISAFVFGGQPLQILTAARRGLIRLDISAPLLDEIHRILRDKFAWSEDMLQRLSFRLSRFIALVHPTQTIDAVPDDPDDNRVLECAVAAGSQHIVTGDGDLLRLGQYQNIRIMRVAEFVKLISP
jgi:putative PIN family toxin of toxin-antitoxin system